MNSFNKEAFSRFLTGKETTLQYDNSTQEILAFVMVPFQDIPTFVELFGINVFEDGHIGIDVSLYKHGLSIEINSLLILNKGSITEYKECFNQKDWTAMGSLIVKS